MTNYIENHIETILKKTGANIRRARLGKELSTSALSERSGIGRSTLWLIENGSGSVSMGNWARVMFELDLESDILKLGAEVTNDPGRKRAPRRKSESIQPSTDLDFLD